MAREKKNKIVQKSIGLTDLEWAIIERLGMEAEWSNGAVVRMMIEDFILFSQLRRASKKIKDISDIYNGRLARKQDLAEIENPYSKELSDLFQAYPLMNDLPDLLKD